MDKTDRVFVAMLMFIIALAFTLVMAMVVIDKNIPLDSIGLWVMAVIPISLYAGAVAILIKEW